MTWTAPSNVSTGNALTALLWNNQLGTNGSLKYLYDTLTPVATARNVCLRRTTNLTLASAAASDIAFDSIVTSFTNQQQNFPITTPVTNIPLPSKGIYLVSFSLRWGAAANTAVICSVTNGTTTEAQMTSVAYIASVNFNSVFQIFSESSSCTFKINVQNNSLASQTATAAAATGTADGNMILRVTKVSL